MTERKRLKALRRHKAYVKRKNIYKNAGIHANLVQLYRAAHV